MKDQFILRKFSSKKYVFVSGMPWYGGWGLADAANPDANHALPERKPGKRISLRGVTGIEVLTHECQAGHWRQEGVLADDGTFYQWSVA